MPKYELIAKHTDVMRFTIEAESFEEVIEKFHGDDIWAQPYDVQGDLEIISITKVESI